MTKVCSKCGVDKPLDDFYMKRPALGQRYGICKRCWTAKGAHYLRSHPGKNSEYYYRWKGRDPERVREVQREGKRRQRADPIRRLRMYTSTAVAIALGGIRKRRPTFELLGYTLDDLRRHLERQFSKGMTWDNYGEWHVDHIVPLSSFTITASDSPEFRQAWALTNLRPLWAQENIRKKNHRTHLL